MNATYESKVHLRGDMNSEKKTVSEFHDVNSSAENLESVRELAKYRTFLRLQAKRITPSYPARIEASDIVQQTMMEACEKMDQFRGRTEPEMAKWLSQMLKNNIADAARALRRKKRDIARERPLQSDSPSAIGPVDWLASDQTTPSICASNAEDLLRLADAIKQLPKDQQDVILLHHLEGRTISQVATQLAKTPSSIAGLLYRGLKSLREFMNQ